MHLMLTLSGCPVHASAYCTKEQYQHDHALIEGAFSSGMLVKGPNGLRDYILVQETKWYEMNYLQQIAFMQSFECDLAGGSDKRLLYMDVRSLATGKLLATWTLGELKPAEEPRGSPEKPEAGSANEDESRRALSGADRAAFIKTTIEECSRRTNRIDCSCYANAIADDVSIAELKAISSSENREMAVTMLRPQMEAAVKRCSTN